MAGTQNAADQVPFIPNDLRREEKQGVLSGLVQRVQNSGHAIAALAAESQVGSCVGLIAMVGGGTGVWGDTVFDVNQNGVNVSLGLYVKYNQSAGTITRSINSVSSNTASALLIRTRKPWEI